MPVGNKRPQQQAASSSQALTATESTPLVAAKDDAPDDNPENPPGYLFVTNRTRGVYTTLAMVALAIATKYKAACEDTRATLASMKDGLEVFGIEMPDPDDLKATEKEVELIEAIWGLLLEWEGKYQYILNFHKIYLPLVRQNKIHTTN